MIRGTSIMISEGSKSLLENFSDSIAVNGLLIKEDFVISYVKRQICCYNSNVILQMEIYCLDLVVNC